MYINNRKIWAVNYLRNLFWYLLDGILHSEFSESWLGYQTACARDLEVRKYMTYEVPQYSHIGYGGIALHVRIIYPVHNIGDTHITAFGAAGWVSLWTQMWFNNWSAVCQSHGSSNISYHLHSCTKFWKTFCWYFLDSFIVKSPYFSL